MKFALVNGQREEAQPKWVGECPRCGSPTVAKYGEVRVPHWAHKGQRMCDPWWENETDWHRAWKDRFPADWQEVVHVADGGERHIADVKTQRGWVIEFQHSYLKPEERRSREAFYPRLIWVLDGTRRKRDRAQFLSALSEGLPVGPWRRVFSDSCAIMREWAGSSAPILIDFGEEVLGWLSARSTDGWSYVAPYPRSQFIESHSAGATEMARKFDALVDDIPTLVAAHEALLRTATPRTDALQPRRLRRPYRF